ncbi:nucleotidyltransferase domain-containing protein [Candidatus Woesearchaeota archaeon]|nr:nucleotidyltransferase domain-containing protein [Candidatus Woesearchaeota archaeon]
MNFLKILPLSQGRLDILFEIYAEGEDYLRNISRKLKMNPSLTFTILNKLHESQFVIKRKVGKEVQYSLNRNRDYEIVVRLLEEYHIEKIINRSKTLKVMINLLINNKELIKSSKKIYLFGSYVLGDYTTESDIDILFVNEQRKLVGKACREISIVIGKSLNPLIYTRKKFTLDLSKKEPLLDSIVNGIKNRAIIKS